MRSVSSIFASSRRLVALGLCLGLAACGSSQNWQDNSQFVTVGGSVTGFPGGSLALWNNGGDRLAIAANGSFAFPLQIASGSTYSVVVATQPAGQSCTVSNGSGTARGDVSNVTVTCVPYTFTRRPLPAVYSTGKAINYSPYRTEGGPITSEVPSDAQILQDLTLLDLAGYDLLRLFGAKAPSTDVVAEKILRVAAQNFPDMKFQLGLDLKGLTSCSDPANDFNIANLISNLSRYPNVVTISVGNETSFFSRYMPLPCLEGYIRTIRAQVTQPVTADDDWTFYAGKSDFESSERVPVKPDTILALIDFASIHMYPFSYTVWDWRKTSVPEGPARAQAMMEQSLVALKEWYGEVVDYRYVGADGITVSVGDSMPITVGETGWKARQTNPAAGIEAFAAREVNAKWYFDLLYGEPFGCTDAVGCGYRSWQGSDGGPPTIFFFQTFDEQWKGIDDGWGLWDIARQARYALCGLPAGPACNDDLYEGAGYYVSGPFSKITFDSPDITYSFVDFGGTGGSAVVADPIGGANKVARVIRSDAAVVFAGTVVGTSGDTVGIIPFDADNTRMTVRVYSPAAGIPVRLKLQRSQDDPNDPSNKVETEVLTTKANEWETLTFDFATQVPGTPPLNTSLSYDQLVIFFNFGKTGAQAGVQTFHYDDIEFIGGGGTGGGGGGALVNGVFADDYVGELFSTAKSVQGGDVGFFFDDRLAATNSYTYAGVAGSAQDPGGVPNFYFGLGLNAPAITDAYFGAYVKAPGNGAVDVSGYTNIQVNVWGPDQLFKAGTFPALDVILQGPAVSGCGSPSGGSEVQATFNTTGQGAAQVYTVPLSSFTVKTACSGETTVAQVLASITQVNIVLVNTNIQYVNKDPDGVAFTNGLNVGSIKFN